jgi:hypothetical protein
LWSLISQTNSNVYATIRRNSVLRLLHGGRMGRF